MGQLTGSMLDDYRLLDEGKHVNMDDQLTHFILRILGNKPITRLMAHNDFTINIIPLWTPLLVGLTVANLKHTSMVIQGFD